MNNCDVEVENDSVELSNSYEAPRNVAAEPTSSPHAVPSPAEEACAAREGETSDMGLKSLLDTLRELNQISTKLLEMKSKLREMRVTAAEELLELSLLHKPKLREVLAEVEKDASSTATALAERSSRVGEQIENMRRKGEDQLSSLERQKEEHARLMDSLECSGKERSAEVVRAGEEENKLGENEMVEEDSASVLYLTSEVHPETNFGKNSVADENSDFVGGIAIAPILESVVVEEVLNNTKTPEIQRTYNENCQSEENVADKQTNEPTLQITSSQAEPKAFVEFNNNPKYNLPVGFPETGKPVTEVAVETLGETDVNDITENSGQVLTENAPTTTPEASMVPNETSAYLVESEKTALISSDAVNAHNLSADLTTTAPSNIETVEENIISLPGIEETSGSNTVQGSVEVVGSEEVGRKETGEEELPLEEQRVTKDLMEFNLSAAMLYEYEQPSICSRSDDQPKVHTTAPEMDVNVTFEEIPQTSESEIARPPSQEKVAEPTEVTGALTNDAELHSNFPKISSQPLDNASSELVSVTDDDNDKMDVTLRVDSAPFPLQIAEPLKPNNSNEEVCHVEEVYSKEVTESESSTSEHMPPTNVHQSLGIESDEHMPMDLQSEAADRAESVQVMEVDG